MSRLVKDRKYMKRHTNGGIEVRRAMSKVEAKITVESKDPSYATRQSMKQFISNRPMGNY